MNQAAATYEVDIVKAARTQLERKFPEQAKAIVPLPAEFKTQKDLEHELKQVLKDTPLEGKIYQNRSSPNLVKVLMGQLSGPLFSMEEHIAHTRGKSKKRKLIFTPTYVNCSNFVEGQRDVQIAAAVAAGVQLNSPYGVAPTAQFPSSPNSARNGGGGPALRAQPRHDGDFIQQLNASLQVTPCVPSLEMTKDTHKDGEVHVAGVLNMDDLQVAGANAVPSSPGGGGGTPRGRSFSTFEEVVAAAKDLTAAKDQSPTAGVTAEVWLRVAVVPRVSMMHTQYGFERQMGWVCTSSNPLDGIGWRLQLQPLTTAVPESEPEPEPEVEPEDSGPVSLGKSGGAALAGIANYWSKMARSEKTVPVPADQMSADGSSEVGDANSFESARDAIDRASVRSDSPEKPRTEEGLMAAVARAGADGQTDLHALASLTVIDNDSSTTPAADEVFEVHAPECLLGRLNLGGGSAISRRHASLVLQSASDGADGHVTHSWWVQPLGKNKIAVNGQRYPAVDGPAGLDLVESGSEPAAIEIWSGDLLTIGSLGEKGKTVRFHTETTVGQSNTYADLASALQQIQNQVRLATWTLAVCDLPTPSLSELTTRANSQLDALLAGCL